MPLGKPYGERIWKAYRSLPVRGRGLKPLGPYPDTVLERWSLPVRGRGLKLIFFVEQAIGSVGRSPCGGVD
jgi:hypothetical protein